MIENAKNPALQFSGGKDSLACLYLLEPYWDRLSVIWCDAGDAPPEKYELIESIRPKVKAVHIVRGNSFNDPNGFPADMVPLRSTPLGMMIEPEGQQLKVQSRYECCGTNFWQPMMSAVKELGFDLLIRGQRDDEKLRGPAQNGAVDPNSGAIVWLPIQTWSDTDVKAYLVSKGVELPRFYEFMESAVDCMHCTAYLDNQRGKEKYLKKYYPTIYTEFTRRVGLVAQTLKPDIDEMTKTLCSIDTIDVDEMLTQHRKCS